MTCSPPVGAVPESTAQADEIAMFTGENISHYRVLEKIGKGGLGEVFLAEDSILNRRVALKFLTSTENAQHREDILQEARAAASIDHPYVCKVFETGEHQGRPFIAMEFLEGETLSRRLKSGSMPFADAMAFAVEIAEALSEAHGGGIVHCDLKPSNIMITRNGHVKLMDFGLSRRVSRKDRHEGDEASAPRPSAIAGTPGYMAPEQARGEELDARVDVFAFGVILFEMLAGLHPFEKSGARAGVTAFHHEDASLLTGHLPGASAPLTHIVQRSLTRDRTKRYSSAAELLQDLVKLRENGGVASFGALAAVAILPFTDLSPQQDQAYFCDGLAEELIVALGTIPHLRVVSRSTSFQYRDTGMPLRDIGRAMQTTAILDGSVRKAGDRLRIVVNLVNTESGSPVWTQKYDRQLDDVFEIQDQIAQAVAEKLRVTFAQTESKSDSRPGSPHPGSPHNVKAWELYLKGRHFWNKRTEDNLRLSVHQYHLALAEDPEYAMAYAGLADAWLTLSLHGAARPVEVMPLAADAAARALALRPNMPEALTSRACILSIFDWDWNQGAKEFEKAIGLNPRHAQTRQWFAMNCLAPWGGFVRAREQLRVASELEPVSLAIATSLGVLDFFEGRYDAAATRFQEVLELDPGFYLAHYFWGQALTEQKDFESAIRELSRAVEVTRGSSESLSALGYGKARGGHTAGAAAILAQLYDREATQYVSPVLIAQVQAGMGLHDDAIGSLARALQSRSTDLVWLAVRPSFLELREDPRCAEILIRTGLRDQLTVSMTNLPPLPGSR